MGVYIKGLELQKEFGNYSGSYTICISEDGVNILGVDGKLYQVVEVKEPHGDLVDRDAFLEDMNCGLWDWSTVDGITATTALKQTMSDLRNAPTVLEAEGKDDD